MPKEVKIHTENNDFQYAEVLKRNRNKRQRYGHFIVEGVKAINALIKSGWGIHAFLYSYRRQQSDWARDLLRESRARIHYDLAPALLEKLSDKEETSEVLAIVEMPKDELERIAIDQNMLLVVFDRPASPGNLGSSIRSCDAFGVSGIVITGHSVDLYHPHTIRGSMGSFFSQTIVRLPSQNELMPWIEDLRGRFPDLQIVGSSARGARNVYEQDFRKPTILIMGNETWGMSNAYSELCTDVVKIPMLGTASSLNVSCACSIILYQAQVSRAQGEIASPD